VAHRAVPEGLAGENRLHALAVAQRQQVHQRAPTRGARGFGQLVDLEAIDLAAVSINARGRPRGLPCRNAVRNPARVVVAWKASPMIGVRQIRAR